MNDTEQENQESSASSEETQERPKSRGIPTAYILGVVAVLFLAFVFLSTGQAPTGNVVLPEDNTPTDDQPIIDIQPDNPVDTGNGGIIATVNGEEITAAQFQEELAVLPFDTSSAEIQLEVLNLMINRILIGQEAEDYGIEITEEEIDAELALNQGEYTDEEFLDLLSQMGLSMESLRELIEENLLITRYLNDAVFSSIEVSDGDLEKYFNENSDEMIQIKASHILYDLNNLDGARDALQRLKDGEDFRKIAVDESIEPMAGFTGGDLGFFRRGEMVEPFANAAFDLDVNEISGIVETQFGYHIIKLTDKKTEFEDFIEDVNAAVYYDMQKEIYDQEIERLNETAEIEKFLN